MAGGLQRRRLPILNPVGQKEVFVSSESQLDSALNSYYAFFLKNRNNQVSHQITSSLVIKVNRSFTITKPISLGLPFVIFDGMSVPIYPSRNDMPVFETTFFPAVDIFPSSLHIKNVVARQTQDFYFGTFLKVGTLCNHACLTDNVISVRSVLKADGLFFNGSVLSGNRIFHPQGAPADDKIDIDIGSANRIVNNHFLSSGQLIIRGGSGNVISGNCFTGNDVDLSAASSNVVSSNTNMGSYTAGAGDQAGLNT
jgi:hypothetical protein